jgi:CheY-like chemotaxis protein
MSENMYRFNKAMIIDDSGTDRYIAEHYLRKFFIAATVITYPSGIDALDYLKQFAGNLEELPQLIFLDIRMPLMDGFEFLSEYEKLPPSVHEYCTLIMISSSIDPEDHARISANSFVKKFINKPLNKEKLLELSALIKF